jgi:hypothetical protein
MTAQINFEGKLTSGCFRVAAVKFKRGLNLLTLQRVTTNIYS